MSYFALTREMMDEYKQRYSAYVKERAAISDELKEKYPLANKGYSANNPDQEEIRRQTKEFKTQFDAFTAEHLNVLRNWVEGTYRLSQRLKANLLRETAEICKTDNIPEMFIINIIFDTYPHIDQSWYVYEKEGKYFFKMKETNKTFHEIEGVA